VKAIPFRVAGRVLDVCAAATAALLRPLGVRFLQIRSTRIGEVGASLGYFVESGDLGWRKRVHGVFLSFPDQRRVPNPCYLNYWRRYVGVITNPIAYRFAFRVAERPGMRHPVRAAVLPNAEEVIVDRALVASHPRWERLTQRPLLQLDPDHERRARQQLARFGIGAEDWFVAVHAREGAFFQEDEGSPERHRNASIASYVPAMRQIVERGGWVVRVGDPTMTPLPPLDRVIDYPHTEARTDWMDVYLAAACRFFLGCSSGLFVIAWSFGRPCALANWNSIVTRPWGLRDLYIPKLWWIEGEERFLTFREALAREFAERANTEELEEAGLRLVDNSEEEISELVDEVFAREEGVPYTPEEEDRQRRLDSISTLYPYGAAARMGTAFLRRHANLLVDEVGASSRGD